MKIIKNYVYNLTYQLLAILLPIITTPYISRVLEADGVGKYSVSAAVANYFVLFGMLGISTYGSRQIAYVRDDKEMLQQTFWEINILRFITMGISITAYSIYLFFFVSNQDKLIYLVLLFSLIASLFEISWFFSGIEDFKKTTTRNIVVKLISVILIITLVRKKSDLWLYALIIALSTLMGQIILWKDIIGKIRFVRPSCNNVKIHFKQTMRLWLPTLSINVYTSLDKVMLGYFASESQAGLYENSQKIVKIITTITTSLATVTVPTVSNIFKNRDKDQFTNIINKSFSVVSFIAIPMSFGIMAIRDSFVPWFFGRGYEDISKLLLISSWLVITLSWSSIFGRQILLSCGKEHYYTISVTIGAILNIILNSILIIRIQATGALLASTIAEYTGMFIMMYFSNKLIDVKKLFKHIYKYFLSSIIMYFIVFHTGAKISWPIMATAIQVAVGLFIYAGLMIINRDPNIKYFINTAKKLLFKG